MLSFLAQPKSGPVHCQPDLRTVAYARLTVPGVRVEIAE
jgi:hypothetical protein